ncbi:fad binding domain-containing protein [Diplodia corticola]|uniref:Fad binding domain-containing protein n=1 Tax=Diplodia corticola TaxID=236234 RepID=A0A1J9RKP7_9PEZI|nr:fad binding domain-containing protein [Diplodia corticola]OJD33163.1 fad binding domain-containing protein [Diplodia corticola]
MADRKFRVAIVGGSIAGLTLALALEKSGIDFVVLEAYPEIAPQVGASIAVLPNGFRVLDQLGCYEDLLKRVNCTIDNFIIRDSDGRVLTHVKHLDHHLVQRHGYPMIFFERRMVIDVLYQHIAQKEKVLTSRRVTAVEERDDGVTLTTENGEHFAADIVIGADGIHSTVGKEIWKTNSKRDPTATKGALAPDEAANSANHPPDKLPVQYRCLFGISEKVPGIAEDVLHHVTNIGSSLFAASGPNDRTYWCLFINTGTTYHGDDLPPYTDEDEAATVRQHRDDAITPTVNFDALYKRKLMSVCTPVHEYVLGTWHSPRCMVVGDAVHKFNPIIGLGGMSAIETCAALTNNLHALLQSHASSSSPIPSSAIAAAFAATQSLRQPRAAALVAVSRQTQHRFAMETLPLRLLNRYVYPGMGAAAALRLLSEAYPGAVSLATLPVPQKPRRLPYHDELLREPGAGRGGMGRVGGVVAGLVGMAALGRYVLFGVGKANGAFGLVRENAVRGAVEEMGGLRLKEVFGLGKGSALGRMARVFVTIFLPVVAGAGPRGGESRLQAGYFLVSVFLPLLAVMLVESYRKRNTWSLLWSPAIWTPLAQLLGLAIVLPLYVLAFFHASQGIAYWMPAERCVPHSASKALLPSVLLGFLVPSALMVLLGAESPYIQEVIALWQLTPVLVSPLSIALAKLQGGSRPAKSAADAPVEDYQDLDMPHLKRLYDVLFLVAAAVHVAVLALLASSPDASVVGAFVPAHPLSPVSTVAAGMKIFFQFDLLMVVLTTLVWLALNVWDMKRVGIVGLPVAKAVVVLLLGNVLVGPGATLVAFWRWREDHMARPGLKAF